MSSINRSTSYSDILALIESLEVRIEQFTTRYNQVNDQIDQIRERLSLLSLTTPNLGSEDVESLVVTKPLRFSFI